MRFSVAALLLSVPELVAMSQMGMGETLFSVITPGTHLRPHCGMCVWRPVHSPLAFTSIYAPLFAGVDPPWGGAGSLFSTARFFGSSVRSRFFAVENKEPLRPSSNTEPHVRCLRVRERAGKVGFRPRCSRVPITDFWR